MCGVFGYVNYGASLCGEQLKTLYLSFAKSCSVRGSHAAGLAYIAENKLHIKKKATNLLDADFYFPPDASTIAAHCRLSLKSDYYDNENNHPFEGHTQNGVRYAMEHNGILAELSRLRKLYGIKRPHTDVDSYFIAQLLDTKQALTLTSLKEVCESLRGSFSFVVLDENNNLYICRGDVPIYLVHFRRYGIYIYASTRDIFESGLSETSLWHEYKSTNLEASGSAITIVPLSKGSILRISSGSVPERTEFLFDETYAIHHNWYMHEITETAELSAQLENLNNE